MQTRTDNVLCESETTLKLRLPETSRYLFFVDSNSSPPRGSLMRLFVQALVNHEQFRRRLEENLANFPRVG